MVVRLVWASYLAMATTIFVVAAAATGHLASAGVGHDSVWKNVDATLSAPSGGADGAGGGGGASPLRLVWSNPVLVSGPTDALPAGPPVPDGFKSFDESHAFGLGNDGALMFTRSACALVAVQSTASACTHGVAHAVRAPYLHQTAVRHAFHQSPLHSPVSNHQFNTTFCSVLLFF